MEQKKKNEKDVLVVRDEKTGEISVVAGLDSKQELLPPVQGADTLRLLPGGGGHGRCGAAGHQGFTERPCGKCGNARGAQGGHL